MENASFICLNLLCSLARGCQVVYTEKEETAPSFQLLLNPKGGGTQSATG